MNGAPLTPSAGFFRQIEREDSDHLRIQPRHSTGSCRISSHSTSATSAIPAVTRYMSANWSSCRSGTPPARHPLHRQQRDAAILPYKGYSSINYSRFGASSAYNGLQVKVVRRFSNRLTINADYTWSKAIDLDDVRMTKPTSFPDYTQLKQLLCSCGLRSPKRVQLPIGSTIFPQFKGQNKLVQLTAGGWE